MKSRVIKVDQLARVEGEGGIFIKIQDDRIVDLKLDIFEPPRFFEAFLRGREYSEAPDITARICGICPVAYQMSAVSALEDAFGITVNEQISMLRRLLYCGEWIESHVLHIYMLHAPGFLGCEDVIEVARDHREVVERALKMKKTGNEIVRILGGREIHPINVRVGGFHRVPEKSELLRMRDDLLWTRDAAVETARLTSTFKFLPFDQEYEFVSLRQEQGYPFMDGRIISGSGLDIAVREYEFHFEERHVAHSNALHGFERGRGAYCVGPLARFNLNFDRLTPLARRTAEEVGLIPPVKNPFKTIIVRSIETIVACEEAIRIIDQYERPEKPFAGFRPVAGNGFGATEAPRGLLYHRYRIGDDDLIKDAKIVPPTAQNQPTIENDLRQFVVANMNLGRDELTWECEQVVRNYDPCISCATHFVRLERE